MLSLATFSASPRSFPISSTTGETMWHGTHHSAQKSTRTGVSDPRTVVWKSASPTEPMFAIVVYSFRSRGASVARRCGAATRFSERSVPRGHSHPGPTLAALPGLRVLGEEPFGVDGRLAALTGRGHGLAVGVVGDVSGREHTGHLGRRRRFLHDQV